MTRHHKLIETATIQPLTADAAKTHNIHVKFLGELLHSSSTTLNDVRCVAVRINDTRASSIGGGSAGRRSRMGNNKAVAVDENSAYCINDQLQFFAE